MSLHLRSQIFLFTRTLTRLRFVVDEDKQNDILPCHTQKQKAPRLDRRIPDRDFGTRENCNEH
jgi:hypothetical protein